MAYDLTPSLSRAARGSSCPRLLFRVLSSGGARLPPLSFITRRRRRTLRYRPPRGGSQFRYSGDFRSLSLLSNEDLATDAFSVVSHMKPHVPHRERYARKTHEATNSAGSEAEGDILCASRPRCNGYLPSTSRSLVGSEGLLTACRGKLGRSQRTEGYGGLAEWVRPPLPVGGGESSGTTGHPFRPPIQRAGTGNLYRLHLCVCIWPSPIQEA